MDLNNEQWQQVADVAKSVGFLHLVDITYQGLHLIAASVNEIIV